MIQLLLALNAELRTSIDLSQSFHLICAITTILERWRSFIVEDWVDSEQNSITEDSLSNDRSSIPKDSSINYMPFTLEMFNLLLDALWRHLEDSVHQTERQSVILFCLLLDILENQERFEHRIRPEVNSQKQKALQSTLKKLLHLGIRKKGKYAILSALVSKYGAVALLKDVPDLFEWITPAFSEGSVCKAAGNCLIAVLKHLKEECGSTWTTFGWIEHLRAAFLSESISQRTNLVTYFVPQLFRLAKETFPLLLNSIFPRGYEEVLLNDSISVVETEIVVSFLGIVLKERWIPNIQNIVDQKDGLVNIPVALLKKALMSSNALLRLNVLELACTNPKLILSFEIFSCLFCRPSEFPSWVDYEIIRCSLKTTLGSFGHEMRNKWLALMEKFLISMKVAILAFEKKMQMNCKASSDSPFMTK